MSRTLRGKLTVRKTKKGFHAEIHYEKEGKSKRIFLSIQNFGREISNLEIVFSMEGNRVVEIKSAEGKILWQERRHEASAENPLSTSQKKSNSDLPHLKVHKNAIGFIKHHGYHNINTALKFNKFIAFVQQGDKQKFDYMKTILQQNGVHQECKELPGEVRTRILQLTDPSHFEGQDFGAIPWKAEVLWRMVVGLGTPHVHETAMTWHHTWSIPYIPGSAIKGVTRGYFLMKTWEKFAAAHPDKPWEETIPCLEAWLMDEPHPKANRDVNHNRENCPVFPWAEENLQDDKILFQLLFGTQEQKGAVIFMDAYPIDKYTIKLDVMNVHYPEYYKGSAKYAADWESPNPVFFLTIVNTSFRGVILLNERYYQRLAIQNKPSAEEILGKTRGLLTEALATTGIGAKTSVGYGVMR